MKTVTVASDNVRVQITMLSGQADDIGSLRCSVEWDATGIGRFSNEAYFYVEDLERFHHQIKELSRVSVGETEIQSVEEEAHLSVGYEKGRILVRGVLIDRTAAKLEFNFETDPGHLSRS